MRVALLGVAAVSSLLLTPMVETPQQLSDESDPEPHAAVAFPPGDLPNSARVYVAMANTFAYSPSGGSSFPERFTYNDPENSNADPSCIPASADPPVISRGDADALVANPAGEPFVDVPTVAYASVLAAIVPRLTPPIPNFVMLVKSAPNGGVKGPGVTCAYIPRPAGTGIMDKTSVAFDPTLVRSPDGTFHRTLYVAWQDGGYVSPTAPPARAAKAWVQAVPIHSSTGGFLPLEQPPAQVLAPTYGPTVAIEHPGQHIPFFEGPCRNPLGPNPFNVFVDDVARGNLWSNGVAATQAKQTAPLYYAFSNVRGFQESGGTSARRIYVERLDDPHRFIACVDEFDAPLLASQGHVEEHDPEMVIDPVTDTVGLVYARPEPRNRSGTITSERIMLAGSDSHGAVWTYTPVDPDDSGADATQPAIALSSFTSDVLDRVFSGVIMVTWYKDGGNGHVNRVARAFVPTVTHRWAPVTTVFNLSSQRFVPMVGAWDQTANRGVFEYQGVAHLPGYAAPGVSAAGGGWIGLWRQPLRNLDAPVDGDQVTLWTRWP